MRQPRNRVVQVRRFGGPDGLEVIDTPAPSAGRGEVRVHVLASSLEYTDTLIRRHVYPQTAARRPPLCWATVWSVKSISSAMACATIRSAIASPI